MVCVVKEYGVKQVFLVGGVVVNRGFRVVLEKEFVQYEGILFVIFLLVLCIDNVVMIVVVGIIVFEKGICGVYDMNGQFGFELIFY